MTAIQKPPFIVGPSWVDLNSDLQNIRLDIPGVGQEAQYLKQYDESFFERYGVDWTAPPISEDDEAPMWIEDVYSMCYEGRADDAIDVLFERINDTLSNGHFVRCNNFLRTIDVKRLDVTLLVAALSITLSASSHLPFRQQFASLVRDRLTVLAPGRVERLLSGLC